MMEKETEFEKMVRGFAKGYVRAEYFYNKLLNVPHGNSQQYLEWCKAFQKAATHCVPLEKWNKLVDTERVLLADLELNDPSKILESDAEFRPNRNQRRGNVKRQY